MLRLRLQHADRDVCPGHSDLVTFVVALCIVGRHRILAVNDELKYKASVLVFRMFCSNVEA